jgi:hypothetical protein
MGCQSAAHLQKLLLRFGPHREAPESCRIAFSLRPHRARFAFLWQDDPSSELEISQAHLSTEPQTMRGLLQAARAHFGSLEAALQLHPGVVPALRARFVTA